ncbi:3-oxoadipate enol-lactonase 2 [Meiothermus luteus]|uniref:3-oxoadipate enol-lactonase 2 n=1 Tax=Meiothermus luteus TaxID=2026184 RepID=A0A399ENQ3_9DEIN|nr:alpha/beta fold hydrolase [Meiothermus luteus]RIH85080.1 3-oxoadipate enol-lactonase 2 [Meiothermus luteus]RMH55184.1 MAG: alpha/beta fold hydrolase [Deinococcota bacterium]
MPEVSVNGTTLFYRLEGPKDAPLLVLLNGIFQRTEAWEPLMPYLGGLAVLRYDMRGQGQSATPPGPYPPELHAADLEALLRRLGVAEYHLLGLSNGGVVAQVHAAGRPQGLQRLILLCTTPRLDPLLRAKVESWRQALELGGTQARLRVALPWVWGRTFLEAHPEVAEEASLLQMEQAAPSPQAQGHLLEGFLQLTDLRPRLGSVQAPTLVLSGEEDLLFPPCYGEETARAIPKAQHRVLPRVGHVPTLENPPLLAQEIRAFLEVTA